MSTKQGEQGRDMSSRQGKEAEEEGHGRGTMELASVPLMGRVLQKDN